MTAPMNRVSTIARRVSGVADGKVALAVAVLFLLVAVFGPILIPIDPLAQVSGEELLPPSPAHWLGTDQLGRDVLTRLVYGTRTSLLLSAASVGAGALAGIPLGLIAGYRSGVIEAIIMRPVDALLAMPSILSGIVVATVLGVGPFTVALTIAIVTAPVFARVIRGAVLKELGKEYVTAAVALGARGPRIVVRHIVPNIVSSVLPQFVLAVATSVVLEASLSFLGLGTQRPAPSWGVMLDDGRSYLQDAPWIVLSAAVAVVCLIGALTGLSSLLTRWLNPSERRDQ